MNKYLVGDCTILLNNIIIYFFYEKKRNHDVFPLIKIFNRIFQNFKFSSPFLCLIKCKKLLLRIIRHFFKISVRM